jgi:tetratricopeptide (TPR) repeat protein
VGDGTSGTIKRRRVALAEARNDCSRQRVTEWEPRALFNQSGICSMTKENSPRRVQRTKIASPCFARWAIGVATALNNLGNVYYDQGDLVHARQYYEQTIEAYREIDERSGLAGGLGNLANVLDSMGNLPEALKMQQAGLAAFREIGDQRGIASTLSNLGNLLAEMGNLPAAQEKYAEALQLHDQTGYKRGMAFALSGLADVLTLRGDLAQARPRSRSGRRTFAVTSGSSSTAR